MRVEDIPAIEMALLFVYILMNNLIKYTDTAAYIFTPAFPVIFINITLVNHHALCSQLPSCGPNERKSRNVQEVTGLQSDFIWK